MKGKLKKYNRAKKRKPMPCITCIALAMCQNKKKIECNTLFNHLQEQFPTARTTRKYLPNMDTVFQSPIVQGGLKSMACLSKNRYGVESWGFLSADYSFKSGKR